MILRSIYDKIYSIIFVILLVGLGYFYFKSVNLQKEVDTQHTKIIVLNQNKKALQSKLDFKSADVQDLAIQVSDLQNDNLKLKNQYNLLYSEYTVVFDSVNILNEIANNIDTTNNVITVEFKGKYGKINYSGATYYFKISNKGTYSINITIDSTIYTSRIYIDSTNTFKNKFYADGNLITNVTTEIDSSAFILLKNNKPIKIRKLGFFDNLQPYIEFSNKQDNIVSNFNLNIGLLYNISNKLTMYLKKYLLDLKSTEIGIRYHPSIREIFNQITK